MPQKHLFCTRHQKQSCQFIYLPNACIFKLHINQTVSSSRESKVIEVGRRSFGERNVRFHQAGGGAPLSRGKEGKTRDSRPSRKTDGFGHWGELFVRRGRDCCLLTSRLPENGSWNTRGHRKSCKCDALVASSTWRNAPNSPRRWNLQRNDEGFCPIYGSLAFDNKKLKFALYLYFKF